MRELEREDFLYGQLILIYNPSDIVRRFDISIQPLPFDDFSFARVVRSVK